MNLTDADRAAIDAIGDSHDAWQCAAYRAGLAAGREQMRDECITACDKEREIYTLDHRPQNELQQMARSACWGCAAAIRLLLKEGK